jgi:hypothetical protein
MSAELCEWNPGAGVPATIYPKFGGGPDIRLGCPNETQVSLGDGAWHLCRACAELPRFRRYRKRRPLRKNGGGWGRPIS